MWTWRTPNDVPAFLLGSHECIYITPKASLIFRVSVKCSDQNPSDSRIKKKKTSLIPKSMRTAIIRTGSVPALNHSFVPGSPRAKNGSASPRISLRLNVGRRRRDSRPATGIRKASSESDMIRPERSFSGPSGVGSTSFTARILEGEECVYGGFGRRYYWTESGVSVKEAGLPGGRGGNGDWSDGKFTGGNADWSKIGAYYQEMLKTDPTNSLLLRNYAKFLDEVI